MNSKSSIFATMVCVLVALFVTAIPISAFAAILDVPANFGTIQSAIDAADAGDTVLVQPGTYYENLVVDEGHLVNLFGTFAFTGNGADIWNTVLDGNGAQIMNVSGADSPVNIHGLVIQNGVGAFGGAIVTTADLSLTICVVRNNYATVSGGAISAYGATPKTITSANCTYMGNSAQDYAGVFFLNNVNLVSVHDLIFGNTANVAGVLAQHNPPVNISFDFCTVVDNSDNAGIGGMWNFGVYGDNGNNFPNQVTITNSVFRNAGYEAATLRTVAGHENIYNISYSDFDTDGGNHGILDQAAIDLNWGIGNFDVDPQIDGNHVITANSPCIDAADPNAPNDADGTRADMGYIPFSHDPGPRTRYVPGVYNTIQGAIDAASEGDEVLVATGTYYENINFNGQNVTVTGNPDNPADVIIDGGGNATVVKFENEESNQAILAGFTITNGLAVGNLGGGILCGGASTPLIQHCIITGNTADYDGGIAVLDGSVPTFEFCTVSNNYANGNDGGFGVHGGGATFNDCTIISNSSGSQTGGINVEGNATLNMTRCVIADNSAPVIGGGFLLWGGHVNLTNCAVYGNSAGNDAGAIHLIDGSSATLVNSIVWNNSPNGIVFRAEGFQPSSANISYSDIQGGINGVVTNDNGELTWGSGNINADPNFVDADNGDFNLQSPSPCFNASDPNSGTDPDGSRMEMGPYYYPNADPNPNRFDVPEEYETIQAAIDATMAEGDTVLVQPGTYYENLVVNEGHLVNLFGTFALTGNGADIWNTVLDGNGAQIMSVSGADSPVNLIGLVIQNGVGAFGGAIVTNSDLSLTLCVLRDNHATVSGGAISAYGATPGTITSANCTYANNNATDYGGVFFLNNVNLESDHDLIFGNTANVGGVLGQHNPPINISFDFCTVVNNSDNAGVGGMWNFGMYGDNGNNYPNQVTITNSIFRNAGYEAANLRAVGGHENIYNISYSDFDTDGGDHGILTQAAIDLNWGAGNIDADPHFVNAGAGNFNLTYASRCIDAADPNAALDPNESRADMGVFYFDGVVPTPWWLTIGAHSQNANDVDNWAGGAATATEGYDSDWDVPEPPHAQNNWVSLYFPHPEFDNEFFEDFSGDYREYGQWQEGVMIWDFEVASDLANQGISFSAEPVQLPFDYNDVNIGIVDLEAGVLENLRDNLNDQTNTDPFMFGEGGGIRQFRLIINDTEAPETAIIAPAEGDSILCGSPYVIQWSSSDISTTGASTLTISFDGGETWAPLGETDAGVSAFDWDVTIEMIGEVRIAVETTDGFGNATTNYVNVTVYDTPPEVTLTYPNGGEHFEAGDVVQVTWDQTDNVGVVRNRLHIWSNDALGYDEWIEIEPAAESYDWTSPDVYSPFMQMEIIAIDGSELEGEDQGDGEFAVTPTRLERDFPAGWALFSVPLQNDDYSNVTLFDDDIEGPFNIFNYSEGGFHWSGGRWGNMETDGETWRSVGYWMALNDPVTVDVEGHASIGEWWWGNEQPGVHLELGWNLVGCPFPTEVPITEVWFDGPNEQVLAYGDAVDAGWILPTVYGYSSEEGGYVETSSLMPWQGFWIQTLADVSLKMVPSRNNSPEFAPMVQEPTPEAWLLNIGATMHNVADEITRLGANSDASTEFDAWFDQPEPPNPPGRSFVSAYFSHNDWAQILGDRFNSDIRAPLAEESADEWTLTVVTGDTGTVTLAWGALDHSLPEGYSATLTDAINNRHVDLSASENYTYFSNGSHQFTVVVTSPETPQPRDLHVPLHFGWNMISLNVQPGDEFYQNGEERGPDVRLILDQLRDEQDVTPVDIFKDEHGKFYVPRLGFSNIPYWNLSQGYMLKVNQTTELVQSGLPITATTPVPLEQGWNLIAYYPTYELSARAPNFDVLAPILEHVTLAKDESGRFLSTRANFSNMPNWHEGKGYQVKVTDDVELVYPSLENNVGALTPNPDEYDRHWLAPVSTGRNMSLLVSGFVGIQVKPGDEVGAFDANGALVGRGVIDANKLCGLAIWGDDAEVEGKQGLMEGETFSLSLWQSSAQSERGIEPRSVLEGAGLTYTTDGFSFVEARAAVEIPLEFSLSEAFPNPFNASTTISFGLPEKSNVRLSIVNLAGQTVTVLLSGEKDAGRHNLRWNAESLSSGVYFVRFETSGHVLHKKVNLLK